MAHEKPFRTIIYDPEGREFSTKSSLGVRTNHSLAKEREDLNLRNKGTQKQMDTNIKKHIQLVARKTVRLATKVKDPKTFEQK